MTNNSINFEAIKKIASALNELNEQVIYVGGAVVSLYTNDPAADDARPTKDVDISLSVASLGELEEMRLKLIARGFIQTAEDNVICRFRYEEVKVDVMNTRSIGWAPANPWFYAGFLKRQLMKAGDKEIYVLPLQYFLATKFTAYNNRGNNNPVTSHDFEDIIYIFDNRIDIADELDNLSDDLESFLKEEFKKILSDKAKQEAIEGNLPYSNRDNRFKHIIRSLQKIANRF